MDTQFRKPSSVLWFNPIMSIVAIACIAVSAFLLIYEPGYGYQVNANGKPVGFVKNLTDGDNLHELVEVALRQEYGEQIKYELNLDYQKGRVEGVELTSEDILKNRIIENLDVYAPAYLIKSDNRFLMALDTSDAAQTVLDKIKAPYMNFKKGAKVSFVQDVKVVEMPLIPVNMIFNRSEAVASLAQPVYLASASRSTLVRGSLERNGSNAKVKPLIDVALEYEELGTVKIKPTVQKVKNSNLTEGKTRVKSEGSPGTKEIHSRVRMINGEVVSENVVFEKVIVAAKPRIIEYGTKPKVSGIVSTAFNYLGTPYVWGGTSPRGFDCSGFTQYVFRKKGIYLPRTSGAQAGVGERVSRGNLKPGDLVCFPGHVGIYIGNDQFIHAPSPGKRVSVASLSSRKNFICGRRIGY